MPPAPRSVNRNATFRTQYAHAMVPADSREGRLTLRRWSLYLAMRYQVNEPAIVELARPNPAERGAAAGLEASGQGAVKQGMANLDEAARRVETAMDRLEHVIDTRVAAPREEAEALRRELAAARDENARMRTAKDDVEQRLDDAITRLRSVLEA